MLRRNLGIPATGLAIVLGAGAASAQEVAEGFALNRFEPSERGSEWFASDSLDLRGHGRFAAGLVIDYAHKPLVLYSRDGGELATIVGDQLYGHLGAAVNVWDRVRFALDFPIAIFQDGEGATTTTDRFELGSNTAVGDLRLSGDVRLYGQHGGPATLAAGVQLFTPTGSREAFTSDGAVRVTPRLSFAGDTSGMVYAAQMGMNVRAQTDSFAGSPMGSLVTFSGAFGARTDQGRVVVGPEIHGSTVFTDGDAFFARRTTPFELVLGGHYTAAKQFRFGAGIGPGLTRAFGTPLVRVLASFEWVQPVDEPPPPPAPKQPSDRDKDKIIDDEDACPDEFGVKTDDPKTNGCPPPKDRDKDKILDDDDACPDEPGVKTDDPKTNGCPPPKDRDGDEILDVDDACPDEPGVKTDDPKTNGCPPPKDRDGDGILDTEDACPEVPGPKNEDPKKNGCPVAHIEKGQIKIREQVQFAYNSAQILKASDFILEAVQKIFSENPEITKVEIQGHTDSKGGDAYNKKLSERRAASVVKWLTSHGIDASRLTSVGHGKERPIDSNETDEGRANNRRVEFHIMEQKGVEKPAP